MTESSYPQQALKIIKSLIPSHLSPHIGLILGSGLNALANELTDKIEIPYAQLPGFSKCSVKGHQGLLTLGHLSQVPVVCMQGRAHYYEGSSHSDILTPIRTLKLLGCETLIITNAAASLRPQVKPSELVVINDHINFQFANPLVGSNDDSFGPRFPTLQNAYDLSLRELLIKTGKTLGLSLTEGVYLATLGPSYETPAEIRAFRILGADVVGMSTVPEVIAARHCDLKVVCISTITNMAAGMSDEYLTHQNVLKIAQTASDKLITLLKAFITKLVR